MTMEMEIEIRAAGDVTVVAIRGNVDGLTADRLITTLRARVDEGSVRLVADCAHLSYTSSAGLRSLLSAVKLVRTKGGDLRLAAVQPQVLRVLDLSGFTSILKHYPDVPLAVSSFAA
jgi:anti-anti-sigma factor